MTRAQFVTWLWREAGKPAVTAQNSFTDVPETAYYADAVNWAASKGVTKGKSDTTFDPNGVVTRAEAVAFLYRTYGQGSSYIAKNSFTDVSDSAYYYNAVQWAYNNNVTYGKTTSVFAPNDTMTREEGITFIARAANERIDKTNYPDAKNAD